MTIRAVEPVSGPRVFVAICHNVDVVNREVARSLIALGWGNRVSAAKEAHGIESITMGWFTKAPRVDALRDMALESAMADGATHVLFLDGDMLHPDDLFLRFLQHVHTDGIVSGFYTQRRMPYGPIAFRDSRLHESGLYRTYHVDHDYANVDERGLREEELVGMGCCLIPLALVEKIGPRPWFEYRNNEQGWPEISEDVPFCEKIRAAGGRIYLDPSIKCGHLYQAFADENHFRRYVEVYKATEERMKGAVSVNVVEPERETVGDQG